MNISGTTKLLPLIGDPVAQVQAPSLFNPHFERTSTDALVVALQAPVEGVEEFCRALLQSSSVSGLLVTVPYKKTLFHMVDRASEAACLAGAVNAIRRDVDGMIVGDLFDGFGFLQGLRASGHDPAGKSVLLLGAGGAGSAIAAALGGAAISSLRIFDPDNNAAQNLASTVADATGCIASAVNDPNSESCEIVINATPLGMNEADALPIDPINLSANTLVADIIMKPAATRLLRHAAALGLPVHPGKPMLEHQVSAYLSFFGLTK